jgi:hypothetical protein
MMKKFWGSQHIEVLDYHAGFIQAWDADIVFTSTRPGVVIMSIILKWKEF